MTRYIKLDRRGYKVIIPTDVNAYLKENKLQLSVIKGIDKEKPSTVQLSKNNKYIGTLKTLLDVVGFKNGNPLDFRESNVILKEV